MSIFETVCVELGYTSFVGRGILAERYGKEGRFYHNLSHIEFMLQKLAEIPHEMSLHHKKAIAEAILWHDVCYEFQDMVRGENEMRSACLYMNYGSGVDESRIVKMIAASTNHDMDQKAAQADPVLGLFLDLDLASFARPWDEYSIDAENVRKEIEPWTGTDTFIAGSMDFISKLIMRKTLYYQVKEWDDPARINMVKRLGDLSSERSRRAAVAGAT